MNNNIELILINLLECHQRCDSTNDNDEEKDDDDDYDDYMMILQYD